MIGIILSGGKGTRLFPTSSVISKQLHHVYDKPMIFYSLSTMIQFGIKKILLISNPEYIENYKLLLGNGKNYGVEIIYLKQNEPKGIAEALIISQDYTRNQNICLLLGDNIFYSNRLIERVNIIKRNLKNNFATVVGYKIKNPNDYGVVKYFKNKPLKIIEKPKSYLSNIAITGLYFYPKTTPFYVKDLKPSKRGELEITDVNNNYLKKKLLKIEILDDNSVWMDLGSHSSLLKGSQFVEAVEERTGYKIGCLEEAAYKMNFISKNKLKKLIKSYPKSSYTDYLNSII